MFNRFKANAGIAPGKIFDPQGHNSPHGRLIQGVADPGRMGDGRHVVGVVVAPTATSTTAAAGDGEQDENDGQSKIKLKVNGEFVEAIRLDGDGDGGGSNNGGFSTFVIKDVDLSAGDDISLAAWGDGKEFVRIDNIVLEGQDQEALERTGITGVSPPRSTQRVPQCSTASRMNARTFSLSSSLRKIGTIATWTGATFGGSTRPSSSECAMISAPTWRVDMPQEVCQT